MRKTEAGSVPGRMSGIIFPRIFRRPVRRVGRLLSGGLRIPMGLYVFLALGLVGGGGVAWAVESGNAGRILSAASEASGLSIEEIDIVEAARASVAGDRTTRAARASAAGDRTSSGDAGAFVDSEGGVGVDGEGNRGRVRVLHSELLSAIERNGPFSLAFLDAHGVRSRLLDLPWVEDAEVSKIYPGKLEIRIARREPFAVWQRDGKLWLIDRSGRKIAPYGNRFSRLPRVVGAGANLDAFRFLSLLSERPALASRLEAAVRVADRRWDMTLRGGPRILLPAEGEAEALDELARLRSEGFVFSGGVERIDMRLPNRLTAKLGEEALKRFREAFEARLAEAERAEAAI